MIETNYLLFLKFIAAVFAALIFEGRLKIFFNTSPRESFKRLFTGYNKIKVTRLLLSLLCVFAALFTDIFLIKKSGDEPIFITVFMVFGMILLLISFNLNKKVDIRK